MSTDSTCPSYLVVFGRRGKRDRLGYCSCGGFAGRKCCCRWLWPDSDVKMFCSVAVAGGNMGRSVTASSFFHPARPHSGDQVDPAVPLPSQLARWKTESFGSLLSMPVFLVTADVRHSWLHGTRDGDRAFLRSPVGPARGSCSSTYFQSLHLGS